MLTTSSLRGIYCNNPFSPTRYKTREVAVGDVIIGGNHPVRLQSMTTTPTMDTEATVAQCIRIIEAGSELVRITAPSINEARNLQNIKDSLRRQGYRTPIVADIHFTPNAAETAARIVEKVRINPGNYADKKKFENISYTDAGYSEELERIRERFTPLVNICREYGTAMRIGTNHGSLSDRILSRYGDTPEGMVESAMEFLCICSDLDYHSIVLSMKASNPLVMVRAYRLLVAKMDEAGMNYPLHLGVTEAGDGEDGRIKSAAGICSLLEDGLGDTIRVSLTEDPEKELPVAGKIASRYSHMPVQSEDGQEITTLPYSPFTFERRKTITVHNTGGSQVPRVVADFSNSSATSQMDFLPAGYRYDAVNDKWHIADQAADFVYTGSKTVSFELPGTLRIITDAASWHTELKDHFPLFTLDQFVLAKATHASLNFVEMEPGEASKPGFDAIRSSNNIVLVLRAEGKNVTGRFRKFIASMIENDVRLPFIIRSFHSTSDAEQFMIDAGAVSSSLFIDGMGDGLWLTTGGEIEKEFVNQTAFGILQAVRARISKTEYISCPSCGRTLFDLQETTARIRSRTGHLKGIKIGIMGCIVNGPGEMADADYGYVGTGPGKITLYKGKEVVARNIDTVRAVDELIGLIRSHGDWIEPPAPHGEI